MLSVTTPEIKPTKPSSELHRLKAFPGNKLEELKNDNGQSFIKVLNIQPDTLEEAIEKNYLIYWGYWILYGLTNFATLLHVVFQINTSNEGIENCVKAFRQDISVPFWFSYGVGASTAVLSAIFYLLVFSPNKEALKSTLKYAYSKSYREKITQAYTYFLESPLSSADALTYLINISILLTCNLTGSMPYMLEIINYILALPIPLNSLIILTVLFFGEKYYKKYMDESYYKGLEFWRDQSKPYLLTELRQKNFFIPLQIILQSSSTIGLRAFYFYYLSEASNKALGFWFPTPMVMACIILHSLCVFHPKTYDRYTKNLILNRQLSYDDQEKYRHRVLAEKGSAYLFTTEPTIIFIHLMRMLTGGFLGWEAGNLISDTITVPIIFMLTLGLLLCAALYLAESERVMQNLIREKIDSELSTAEKPKMTLCERITDYFASFLNFSDFFSTTTSYMGSGVRLVGLSMLVPFWSIERGLCFIDYNDEYVHETAQEVLVPNKCRSSKGSSYGRFFQKTSSTQPVEINVVEMENLRNVENFVNNSKAKSAVFRH